VNTSLIYIGGESNTISHFSSILNNRINFFSRYLDAENFIISQSASERVLILFEKGKIEEDLPKIGYLKDKFPGAYIVLVTKYLPKEEIREYKRAGVGDTSSPTVSKERLLNAIEFLERNPEIILSSFTDSRELSFYTVPVWKRVFDILFSLIALIALMPLLIVVVIAIVVESSGAPIYCSQRVGSNYKIFNFYKFRSMYRDSESRVEELKELNRYRADNSENREEEHLESDEFLSKQFMETTLYVTDDKILKEEEYLKQKKIKESETFVKYSDDPRVTAVGRILRKYSIDELPQLYNILRGDMSVVGNRPLPLYEAEQLTSDQYIDRFLAPCGLTGLWQVEKRGDEGKLSPEERRQLDLYYAKNYSIWMDIKIIFKTFSAFIQKENV